MTLINTEVSAQFFIHLKVSMLCGLVIAFPYVIYEIWKFVSPALYEHELKSVRKGFLIPSVDSEDVISTNLAYENVIGMVKSALDSPYVRRMKMMAKSL